MDDLDFSKLLQDAEALSAEIDWTTDVPRVQRNLRQVVEAGQLLVNKISKEEPVSTAETKASIFLGARGVDITKLTKKLEPLYQVVTTAGDGQSFPLCDDFGGFLTGERNTMTCSIWDSTAKSLLTSVKNDVKNAVRKSWEVEREKILAELNGCIGDTSMDSDVPSFSRHSFEDMQTENIGISILSKTELTYSHEVNSYVKALITNQPKPNLLDRFEIVAGNLKDRHVEELWESVSKLIVSLPVNTVASALEKRSDPVVQKGFIIRAKQYLEKQFFIKVHNEVSQNLGHGRLGGIPSVTSILKTYISLKNILNIKGLEIGPGDTGPVWATVYIFLRSGYIEEAIKYLRDEAEYTEFAKILVEYSKNTGYQGSLGLPKDIETQLRMDYLRILRGDNKDPYKKFIYCLIGACDVAVDHPEIAVRLDDYLWLKLSQLRAISEPKHHSDYLTLATFQDMMLVQYGETHFDAFKQPFTYFHALWLTAQFEAAIEFLARVGSLRTHAVHIAIILEENGLLLYTDPKSAALTRQDDDPPGFRRLNYCQLLIQYSKSFQNSNTNEALNYLYLLRNITDNDGENQFSACINELAVERKNYETLFGELNPDGCRTPGVLESMGINIRPILDYCANKSEDNGLLEDAVLLYDLGGKPESALRVLNRLLCRQVNNMIEGDSSRERIQKIAITLAERYHNQQLEFSDRLIPSTFYLLVDIMTFYDEFHAGRCDTALMIMDRIRILPFEHEDVERCIRNFPEYTEELRKNIPDLILATMECIHAKYKKIKLDAKSGFTGTVKGIDLNVLDNLKLRAKILVTYCGLVPYFMTGDIYSRVIQIEVQIN